MKNRSELYHYVSCLWGFLTPLICSCDFHEVARADISNACSSEFSLSKSGAASSFSETPPLDVFVFNDEGRYSLDVCQRVPSDHSTMEIRSTSGDKIAVVVANADSGKFTYMDVLSYDNLCNVTQRIADENPSAPVMSGECRFRAGRKAIGEVELLPILCKIRVAGINVNFRGRPYENEKLTDMKAYLTNVSGLCRIVGTTDFTISEVLNYGGLDPASIESMSHPEMLYNDNPADGCVLYCYPCPEASGELGRVTTRLVIEGKVKGNTYYYPIDIAKEGIRRGVQYSYDITLTRTGSIDPDTPLEEGTVILNALTEEWKEYDNEEEYY